MPRTPNFLANELDEGLGFFTVTQLMMVWTAHREGHITLRDLRVYFALAETLAKSRCFVGARGEAAPKFSTQDLRQLLGGGGGVRNGVKKLLAVGLLRDFSKSTIEFATDPSELRFMPATLDAALARTSNNQRLVPVPRPILRLIASGARRTLIVSGRSNPATDGRLKPSHFEETQMSRVGSGATPLPQELHHGESAQDGHQRDHSYTAPTRLVPAPHRRPAGRQPRDRRATPATA